MSSTSTTNAESSSEASDLSLAFDANLEPRTRGRLYSTTQKEQQHLDSGNDQRRAETESEPAAEPTPAPGLVAALGTSRTPAVRQQQRRKQLNPIQRLARLRREVNRLQASPFFMIPRLSFGRVVRELMMKYTVTSTCITFGALEALQTATEMFLTQRFEDAYIMTLHRGRVTLEVRDMALVAYICKSHGNDI